MIEYTITRTRRRTCAIYIRSGGAVEVRAPLRLPKREIERFVKEKETWILRKQEESKRAAEHRAAFPLCPGCEMLFRQVARPLFTEKTRAFAPLVGAAPAKIRVTSAKTRWGSCSSRKTISYSWRLAMADDSLVDYVVVHELAHLKEMNHSKRFWQQVAAVLPDYQERKAKLKTFAKTCP
jgi:predicted metal-dependent hydrolase